MSLLFVFLIYKVINLVFFPKKKKKYVRRILSIFQSTTNPLITANVYIRQLTLNFFPVLLCNLNDVNKPIYFFSFVQ